MSEINNLTKASLENYNRKKLEKEVVSNNAISTSQARSQTPVMTQIPNNNLTQGASKNRPKRKLLTSTPSGQSSSQVSSLKLSGVPKVDDDDFMGVFF